MARPTAASAALSLLLSLPAFAGATEPTGSGAGKTPDVSTSELTSAEQALARNLAENHLAQSDGESKGHLYFIRAELFRDKALPERLARVIHYRYEGDLTMYTVINLSRSEVVNVESRAKAVTAFSAEEMEIAKQLALADPVVKAELATAGDSVQVEALPVHATRPSDPLFGHRVLHLLFRSGSDYLRTPMVMVDLNRRSVVLQPATTGKGK